jgi:hypothetical protein
MERGLPVAAQLMNPERRNRLLTVGWNNRLSVVLGLPALAVAGVALFTSTLSDGAAFALMALIGVVY